MPSGAFSFRLHRATRARALPRHVRFHARHPEIAHRARDGDPTRPVRGTRRLVEQPRAIWFSLITSNPTRRPPAGRSRTPGSRTAPESHRTGHAVRCGARCAPQEARCASGARTSDGAAPRRARTDAGQGAGPSHPVREQTQDKTSDAVNGSSRDREKRLRSGREGDVLVVGEALGQAVVEAGRGRHEAEAVRDSGRDRPASGSGLDHPPRRVRMILFCGVGGKARDRLWSVRVPKGRWGGGAP